MPGSLGRGQWGTDNNHPPNGETQKTTHLSVPGQICLYSNHGQLHHGRQVSNLRSDTHIPGLPPRKSKAHTLPPEAGIRVNEESHIKAGEWAAKIKACDGNPKGEKICSNIPDYYRNQVRNTEQFIYLRDPDHFQPPTKGLHALAPRTWMAPWVAVLRSGQWEITTAELVITVDPSNVQESIKGVLVPDLGKGEDISKGLESFLIRDKALTKTASTADDFGEILGSNFPGADLKSQRDLIAIADRVVLKKKGIPDEKIPLPDQDLLHTWVHEIACHAGLGILKRYQGHAPDPDHPGEIPEANSIENEIETDIPHTKIVKGIFDKIQSLLNSPAAPKPQGR